MADEQQVNAGGVETPASGAGNATAATPQPGAQQPVTQAQTPAQAQTDDPKFREWQAARDRERAALLKRIQDAETQAQRAKREAEEARLADADPVEREKFYKEQLAQVERQSAEREQRVAEDRAYAAEAMAALNDAGIKPDDERLVPYIVGLDDAPWSKRMASLARGIAAIQREEMQALRAEIAKAEKRGGQKALEDAGVTQTSGAASAPVDTTEAKAREYREQLKRYKRSGNLEAVVALQTKAEREGISL